MFSKLKVLVNLLKGNKSNKAASYKSVLTMDRAADIKSAMLWERIAELDR